MKCRVRRAPSSAANKEYFSVLNGGSNSIGANKWAQIVFSLSQAHYDLALTREALAENLAAIQPLEAAP